MTPLIPNQHRVLPVLPFHVYSSFLPFKNPNFFKHQQYIYSDLLSPITCTNYFGTHTITNNKLTK